ncbi:3-oxoadipate enol-lactonase [Marinovum sp.]|uniref:3-oxoadipate enol-lactonase n=1 Tax=Marinovum sp. TaxID=2024839 RepID=UPI002B278D2B|nr:3-oxoadipate enol-lactonase [Marinovum sp.]
MPQFITANGIRLHIDDAGPKDAPPVVFGNALGCDMRIWDAVLPHLPPGLRLIRYDTRGHGLSDCPPGPYAMGTLVRDAEALLDALQVREAVFVGLSLGGMVAQGLAVKRLDLLRAVVLSNTAARIGTAAQWQQRIDAVGAGGPAALTDTLMPRWFTRAFRDSPPAQAIRSMVERQPGEGYAGCCAAISGTDFYTPTSGLRLPCLGIAASEDGSTPADLVRETVELIPGARFALLRRAGHMAPVERPEAYAALLSGFLREIGHV